MRYGLIVFLVLGAWGCRGEGPSKPQVATTPPPKASRPADPDQALYEQLRSASFQFGVVATSLEEALVSAQKLFQAPDLPRPVKEKLADAIAALDDLGGSATELADAHPTLEAVRKDFAKYDEKRLSAIAEATEMLSDLEDALHTVDTAGDGQDEELRTALGGIEGLIQVALDDLRGAIEAAGGTLPGTS
ncbi:MAG TPA: hypothetical protein VEX38_03270 [Fimbriimonadaceae bacterium]|nr:hypothetical protein [Fimbriimonadaceae bacterium]